MDKLNRYMHLDFGPCGIHGPTDPVVYEDRYIRAKVEIPRKCLRCCFLFNDIIHGFSCRKDAEKWGDCYRGLDWGQWQPDRIFFDLPHPKVTTKALADAAHVNDLKAFVIEYRRANPGLSMDEARRDFARIRELISSGAEG
ncbi:hypothetical protein [Brevifollis gellanilyticus]|uniref:Uncharacterized protein n=1 Tax=Brevifollis gellanilyticus TaxID=748831 RepID=A0A512MGU2_9BACT|nr:hypothetical protein [Brevifollis gellanilyticus]GEP45953.1 hypothetical protein BGE01nite_52440 [Brevifollis gellanilyticus]